MKINPIIDKAALLERLEKEAGYSDCLYHCLELSNINDLLIEFEIEEIDEDNQELIDAFNEFHKYVKPSDYDLQILTGNYYDKAHNIPEGKKYFKIYGSYESIDTIFVLLTNFQIK
jgi:hypothetical protein